jgi:hypothetical protein
MKPSLRAFYVLLGALLAVGSLWTCSFLLANLAFAHPKIGLTVTIAVLFTLAYIMAYFGILLGDAL